jgi:hypothetical protein
MATIKWFNSINGFSVGDELTEVIDTSGNVFTSKITSYIDVDIVSDNGNKIWNFDSTGNVVFPDTTTQTTAYPGTSTTLSLTGNISAGNVDVSSNVTAQFYYGDGRYLTGIAPTIQQYLFSNVASDISPYYQAIYISDFNTSSPTANSVVTIGTTGTLLAEFLTNANFPGITTISIGQLFVRYETQKASGANSYTTYSELWKRTSGGTETLLLTSDLSTPTALNVTIQQAVVMLNTNTITLDLTDRLAVKLYGYTNSGTDSITTIWGGTTDSGVELPTPPASSTQFVPYQNAIANLNLGTKSISANNANLGNLTTSNYFHGVFDATSSSQPNISSVGNLSNLFVGNATANVIILGGNITATGSIDANNFNGNFYGNFSGNIDVSGNIKIGGSNTQVLYNANGDIQGSNAYIFDYIGNVLTLTGNLIANAGVFYGNTTTGKNALQVGNTSFTAIPNTIAQFTSNLNSATQINFQNINTGATSSTDIALTSDNGNSVNNYINMGITGSAWDGTQTNSLGNALTPDDGYLYVRGGNLVIGTSKIPSAVKFIVGGPGTANIVATINRTNVDVTGDIIASGNANITGNISSTAGLLTLSTGTLAVSGGDAGIFTTAIGNINFGLVANISMGSTTGNVTARGNLIVNDTATITNLKVSDVYSNRTPIVVTTSTVIDSFPVIKYRSAKYTMRVNSDDGYQAVEVLLIHDNANSYVTIYGSLSTVGFDIIALSTDILSGNVRMLATTGSANTTVNLLGVYVAD